MKYVEHYPIQVNKTILIIGKIIDLYIDDNLLEPDVFINLSKARTVAINGLDGYTIPKLKTRLEYQRPKNTTEIKL